MLCVALLPLAGCIETVDGPDAATETIQLDERMVVRRGGLTFVKGWDLGRRVAAERQRPALVFFTAQWCTYCHKMEATTFADPAVAQAAGEFVHRVTQTALAERTEEAEILSDLGGCGATSLRQFGAGNGRVPLVCGVLEKPQIQGQAADGRVCDPFHCGGL